MTTSSTAASGCAALNASANKPAQIVLASVGHAACMCCNGSGKERAHTTDARGKPLILAVCEQRRGLQLYGVHIKGPPRRTGSFIRQARTPGSQEALQTSTRSGCDE